VSFKPIDITATAVSVVVVVVVVVIVVVVFVVVVCLKSIYELTWNIRNQVFWKMKTVSNNDACGPYYDIGK
jgi:biopolymer transport protein ExbB/TolQ